MLSDFQIARGVIEDVFFEEGIGPFCSVRLRHYTFATGEGLIAICRLTTPYHGKDFGDWWTPQIGVEVIVAFPGMGPDGSPGADLEDGYILGYTINKKQPAQPTTDSIEEEGEDTIPGLRISEGKPDEDKQDTIHGTHTTVVDGDLVETISGTHTLRITIEQDVEIDEDASWLSKQIFRLKAATQLLLTGTVKVTIDSDTIIQLIAPTVEIGLAATAVKVGGVTTIVSLNGIDWHFHTHSGVETGAGISGPVVI